MGLFVFEAGGICKALSPFSLYVLAFAAPRSEQSLFWDLFRMEQLVAIRDTCFFVVDITTNHYRAPCFPTVIVRSASSISVFAIL